MCQTYLRRTWGYFGTDIWSRGLLNTGTFQLNGHSSIWTFHLCRSFGTGTFCYWEFSAHGLFGTGKFWHGMFCHVTYRQEDIYHHAQQYGRFGIWRFWHCFKLSLSWNVCGAEISPCQMFPRQKDVVLENSCVEKSPSWKKTMEINSPCAGSSTGQKVSKPKSPYDEMSVPKYLFLICQAEISPSHK